MIVDMGEPRPLRAVPPLGTLRKQAEQALGSKPVSNVPPRPLLQFLPRLPFVKDYRYKPNLKNQLSSPSCLGHGVLARQQKP